VGHLVGDHPQSHLAGFTGHLVADAYAGFNALYAAERQPGPVMPVACWAHARRKFHDVYAARQSPIAQEALGRIAALYAVEKTIGGRPPDERYQARQERSRPVAEDLFVWMETTLPKLSGRSDLAAAVHYALVGGRTCCAISMTAA
jgi:transposase